MKSEVFAILHVSISMEVENTEEIPALLEAGYKLEDIQHLQLNAVLSEGVLNLKTHNVDIDMDSFAYTPEGE